MELGIRGTTPHRRRQAVGAWVTAEEADVAADAPQAHQRLAHPGIDDVAFAVDREAVPAEPDARGTRLDPRQVDAAHRELGQDLEQRARVVVADERDE